MVILSEQNVIADPPFTRIDLLLCHNLLIYITSELQQRLLALFHYSLNPNGILFLGSAEAPIGASDLFTALDNKWRFFRRQSRSIVGAPMQFNVARSRVPSSDRATAADQDQSRSLKRQLEQFLLQRVTPVAVLINPRGDLLYTTGRTGQFLEPAVGQGSLNLFSMAREGLREVLPTLCERARKSGDDRPVTRRGLRVRTNGDFQLVDVGVYGLHGPESLHGLLLVVFHEREEARPGPREGQRMPVAAQDSTADQLEIQLLQQALQTLREEMQTSEEELKSSNEELQSTNEELQATNEELTASKEEMQSLNEELQTVNAELKAKVDNLSRVNDDMKNLLDSTEIATLFLEDDLRIRRFTSQAAAIFNLIQSDIGRPITNMASDIVYPQFASDVNEVLRTLIASEKLIGTRGGQWFNVRIMPYRTLDNRIDGVVVTLLDMTEAKAMEDELREALRRIGEMDAGAPAAAGRALATTKNGDPEAAAEDDAGPR